MKKYFLLLISITFILIQAKSQTLKPGYYRSMSCIINQPFIQDADTLDFFKPDTIIISPCSVGVRAYLFINDSLLHSISFYYYNSTYEKKNDTTMVYDIKGNLNHSLIYSDANAVIDYKENNYSNHILKLNPVIPGKGNPAVLSFSFKVLELSDRIRLIKVNSKKEWIINLNSTN